MNLIYETNKIKQVIKETANKCPLDKYVSCALIKKEGDVNRLLMITKIDPSRITDSTLDYYAELIIEKYVKDVHKYIYTVVGLTLFEEEISNLEQNAGLLTNLIPQAVTKHRVNKRVLYISGCVYTDYQEHKLAIWLEIRDNSTYADYEDKFVEKCVKTFDIDKEHINDVFIYSISIFEGYDAENFVKETTSQ